MAPLQGEWGGAGTTQDGARRKSALTPGQGRFAPATCRWPQPMSSVSTYCTGPLLRFSRHSLPSHDRRVAPSGLANGGCGEQRLQDIACGCGAVAYTRDGVSPSGSQWVGCGAMDLDPMPSMLSYHPIFSLHMTFFR